MNTFNQPLYIFHLIDEGLSQQTLSDFDLRRLAVTSGAVVSNYLAKHGYACEEGELRTDDGYAMIIRSQPGNPGLEETVWTYSFDGEISIEAAFQQLNESMIEILDK